MFLDKQHQLYRQLYYLSIENIDYFYTMYTIFYKIFSVEYFFIVCLN